MSKRIKVHCYTLPRTGIALPACLDSKVRNSSELRLCVTQSDGKFLFVAAYGAIAAMA